jgi:parvulin-like peptidyl-prolyl isomerase
MSKKTARRQGARDRTSKLRDWRVIAIAAGITALVVAAVVMAVGGANDVEIAAIVNGQRITADDVRAMQARHKWVFDEELDPKLALEQAVNEELLYQEAVKDHALTMEEAEQELEAQLAADGFTVELLKADLEKQEIDYDEYLETFRREVTVGYYLAVAVNVTEEEARERYDQYASNPELELPPFDEVKEQIILQMEEEILIRLLTGLRANAVIEYPQST